MTDKTSYQLPRYRELYEQLRRHIEEGVYGPGDLLPSENELCAVNQVTRPTVRRALDLLANEGYIKKHQGLYLILFRNHISHREGKPEDGCHSKALCHALARTVCF